jgi:hypothetical protein
MGKKKREPQISEVTEEDNLALLTESLNSLLNRYLEWKIDSGDLVKALLNFHFHLFVMKLGDKTIGMGILYVRHMLFSDIAHLDYIYIHDKYETERNIWEKLLSRMTDEVRGHEVDCVRLLERAGSSIAKDLLLEMGFDHLGGSSFIMWLK